MPTKRKKKGPVMPRAGKTVAGSEYVTTHTCPMCESVLTTIGVGYPAHRCSCCGGVMRVSHKKVEG
jgi:hypothetical protein